MKRFLGRVFATLIALGIFTFLVFFFLSSLISSASMKEAPTVAPNSVLHLKLDRPIAERAVDDPLSQLNLPGGPESTIGLREIKTAIKKAKTDSNIKGIYLECGYPMAGPAIKTGVRQALENFKASGKFILAYSEFYSEGGYYLASVADDVILHPQGLLEFNGLSSNTTFIKGALEKLDVEPQVFRTGAYKSAVEPLMQKTMSPENEEQTSEMINSVYDTYLTDISASRGIDKGRLMEISDSLLVQEPKDAMKHKLVTQLGYFDEALAKLREYTGTPAGKDIPRVAVGKYGSVDAKIEEPDGEVAIVVASGEIVSGQGEMNQVGSDPIAKEIRKLRQDDKIKAIVLRVNSPGGSALASDVIWREVKLAAQEKPVIASMSDLAASGGYYIAMAADTIVAQPNTITGSIGVFAVIFNFQGLLENKLGITNESVNTGQYSDLFSMTRPLTRAEQRIFQQQVDNRYEDFISKVAEGRDISMDSVKTVASGRVWTGEQALNNGLVDVLGGIDKAVMLAASNAGLENYEVNYYPKPKTYLERLMEGYAGNAQAKVLKRELGTSYEMVKKVQEVRSWEGIQARLPYKIELD